VDEDLERELRASDLALLAPSRGCPPRRGRRFEEFLIRSIELIIGPTGWGGPPH
jgi:hypothetical protein